MKRLLVIIIIIIIIRIGGKVKQRGRGLCILPLRQAEVCSSIGAFITVVVGSAGVPDDAVLVGLLGLGTAEPSSW